MPSDETWCLLPHPDDEFALLPWLQARRDASPPVRCLVMTDGAFGGQSSARREAETVAALARLGVPADRIEFLGRAQGFADGRLVESLDAAAACLEARARAAMPTELVVPAWEGGHPDHDASHLLGVVLGQAWGVPVRQYALYHGEGLPGPCFRVIAPLPANGAVDARPLRLGERLRWLAACLHYPSQWRSFVGLVPGLAWRLLRDGSYGLQPVDPARLAQPPHAGRLLYERRGMGSAGEFQRRADAFRAARGGRGANPG